MSSPEVNGVIPEVNQSTPNLVCEALEHISRGRHLACVALEQIKGSDLAELFLQGYASRIEASPTQEGQAKHEPLQVAILNIRHMAGYYAGTDEALEELLRPWNTAYDKLAQP